MPVSRKARVAYSRPCRGLDHADSNGIAPFCCGANAVVVFPSPSGGRETIVIGMRGGILRVELPSKSLRWLVDKDDLRDRAKRKQEIAKTCDTRE